MESRSLRPMTKEGASIWLGCTANTTATANAHGTRRRASTAQRRPAFTRCSTTFVAWNPGPKNPPQSRRSSQKVE